jgi:thymidylate synthase (FAD)
MSSEIKVLDKGFVRLVDSMGSDESIVQAARVSYGKGTKKVSEDEGLIRYLLRNSHTTPFEMVQFKFHIKAPIFIIRQWHRHRMWSYNEYSGRYSEMKDEFYVPEERHITKQNPNNKQGGSDELVPDGIACVETLEYAYGLARNDYEVLLKTGLRKELARICLPLSQYSEMYASVDLHNLFHFLKLRLDSHAQYEIRVYAEAIAELIRPIVPVAYKAFEDYVIGSTKFSQIELAVLQDYIQNHHGKFAVIGDDDVKNELISVIGKHITNKREAEEALAKLLKII